MRVIYWFLPILLIQSCVFKTEKGFRQWMDLQINKPIADVYKKGFFPVNSYKDNTTKITYLIFPHSGGIYHIRRGRKSSVYSSVGSSRQYELKCNIIWVVDENEKRVSYDYNGNYCKEFEVEYLLKNGSNEYFSSIITAPALQYASAQYGDAIFNNSIK